jgi:hypothetical protein
MIVRRFGGIAKVLVLQGLWFAQKLDSPVIVSEWGQRPMTVVGIILLGKMEKMDVLFVSMND